MPRGAPIDGGGNCVGGPRLPNELVGGPDGPPNGDLAGVLLGTFCCILFGGGLAPPRGMKPKGPRFGGALLFCIIGGPDVGGPLLGGGPIFIRPNDDVGGPLLLVGGNPLPIILLLEDGGGPRPIGTCPGLGGMDILFPVGGGLPIIPEDVGGPRLGIPYGVLDDGGGGPRPKLPGLGGPLLFMDGGGALKLLLRP